MNPQQAIKEEQFTRAFQTSLSETNEATWLRAMRENAFAVFAENGFPTVAAEDWKYTNVSALAKTNFSVTSDTVVPTVEQLTDFVYEETEGSRVVFVNGKFIAELSDVSALPENVKVLNLSEALGDARFGEQVKQHLGRLVEYDANGLTALNTAFLSDGAFVFVPRNTQVETPIHLLFVSTNGKAGFPRALVIAETGSESTIVESYATLTGAGGTASMTSAVVEIAVAANAKVTHYRVQNESTSAYHIGNTGVSLQRDSRYDSTNINFGARLFRHDINLRFNEEAGEAWVDGLYVVGGDQHTDTHSLIDHRVPNCTSHQTYKGILDGKSRAVFNGKVFVREGASGTDGYQSNKNLILSNDARVDTKPQLEIFNDDVKCSHGATVGQLEDEEVFYLRSRGLSLESAKSLLTYGFAEELIGKITIESIKKQLDEAVLNRLTTRL